MRTKPKAVKRPCDKFEPGWSEAAIAWNVCASIHREYGQGRDPFFRTRQADFLAHHKTAMAHMRRQESKPNVPRKKTPVEKAKRDLKK